VEGQVEKPLVQAREDDGTARAQELVLVLLVDEADATRTEEDVRDQEEQPRRRPAQEADADGAALTDRRRELGSVHYGQPPGRLAARRGRLDRTRAVRRQPGMRSPGPKRFHDRGPDLALAS